MLNISWYLLFDLIKNKALILYSIILLISTLGLLYVEPDTDKVMLSVMQICILGIPLFCLLFSAIYYYQSTDFIQLILAQPLKRGTPITSLFIALFTWFSVSFILSVCIPLSIAGIFDKSIILFTTTLLIQVISIAIALFIGTIVSDKAKGIGIILLIWAFFVFIFDGILLFIMYQYAAYPIEKIILAFTFLNPITIGRTLIVLGTEASALLGLSAAVFSNFFSNSFGFIISIASLLIWGLIPLFFSFKVFQYKDF